MATPSRASTSNVDTKGMKHPAGFKFIFWGELAERASFYGMRTVLALYMTDILLYSQANASAIMPAFMAACYITPLLGGWLADRVLGRYKTILYFSGPYILGHIILGGWESRPALFIALVLLALGSGSIKPNTSTLMGAMYEEQKKEALLTKAFSYFYAAINVGSAIATLALPWIRDRITDGRVAESLAAQNFAGTAEDLPRVLATATAAAHAGLSRGYAVALTIPAALMFFAFGFFALGKKHYPKENVRDLPPKTDAQRSAERATLGRIAGIFACIVVFWFVYDESASTWIYFATDHMNLQLWKGFEVTGDQIQGLNPVLIVVLTPIFNSMWDLLKARRGGKDVPDTRKMLLGFFIVIGCMLLMAFAGYAAGNTTKVSVWWMCFATFVITMSELCISVVGLEFAFKVAAPGTKSVVTAAFLFTVFVGDSVQSVFNKALWGSISPGNFFALQAGICAATAAAFIVIARRFEREPTSPSETAEALVSAE